MTTAARKLRHARPVVYHVVAATVLTLFGGSLAALAVVEPEKSTSDLILAEVPALQRFVVARRGLDFKSKVDITVLDESEFSARLRRLEPHERAELEERQPVLRTLGLIGRGDNLVSMVMGSATARLAGFYDPRHGRLVVKAGSLTPSVRATLVHELTHALDDQNFELEREIGDEAEVGLAALAEGSGLRIEQLYKASLPEDERRALAKDDAEAAAGQAPIIPPAVQVLLSLPFSSGLRLVEAIVTERGADGINAAFASPPQSTEQVVDPQRYLDGDQPSPVPEPAADGTIIRHGQLGQVFLRLILENGLDRRTASGAAAGWDGDAYVAWQKGPETCVRAVFAMDTVHDHNELATALSRWATTIDGGSATTSGTSFTICR